MDPGPTTGQSALPLPSFQEIIECKSIQTGFHNCATERRLTKRRLIKRRITERQKLEFEWQKIGGITECSITEGRKN
jgi:hypothetical protein